MKKQSLALIALVVFTAATASAQTKVTSSGQSPRSEKNRPVKRAAGGSDPRVLRVGPSTTYLMNGLTIEEVVRFLGEPASVSTEQDGDMLLTVYTFSRSEDRVFIARFRQGVLIGSGTEARVALSTGKPDGGVTAGR